MKNKIIFIGGIGSSSEFGGVLTKNKNIIAILKKHNYNCRTIDTNQSRGNIAKLSCIFINILFVYLFTKRTIIFSTSFGNIYPIIKILYYIPIKRDVIYWGIGGLFANRVKNGEFKAKYMKLFSHILVEGNMMKDTLIECGLKNIEVVPNFKEIQTLPIINKFDDGKIHLVFLSRIHPEKGVPYIFKAMEILNKNGYKNKYEVDFYGQLNDLYMNEFNDWIAKLPNAKYCNIINLLDWENYGKLAQYHFMLFPTYWHGEGFPGVIIDAFISGVPILASDWNLNSEFIKNKTTGIIIPTHNCDELYKEMQSIIDGNYNLNQMAINCQKEVKLYNTTNVLNDKFLLKLFNSEC